MKHISLKITLIGIAIVALYIIWPSENPAEEGVFSATEAESKIPFSAATIAIPTQTAYYLQNSLLYGNDYNENQKFVVYFTDNTPYPQTFLPALNKIMQTPHYQSEYSFLPRNENPAFLSAKEKLDDADFMKLCRQFCIVNPQRGEIFYIDGIGEEDAKEIGNIFDSLENW